MGEVGVVRGQGVGQGDGLEAGDLVKVVQGVQALDLVLVGNDDHQGVVGQGCSAFHCWRNLTKWSSIPGRAVPLRPRASQRRIVQGVTGRPVHASSNGFPREIAVKKAVEVSLNLSLNVLDARTRLVRGIGHFFDIVPPDGEGWAVDLEQRGEGLDQADPESE